MAFAQSLDNELAKERSLFPPPFPLSFLSLSCQIDKYEKQRIKLIATNEVYTINGIFILLIAARRCADLKHPIYFSPVCSDFQEAYIWHTDLRTELGVLAEAAHIRCKADRSR